MLSTWWLVGCNLPREGQPSILVIAVEGLGFESIGCESDDVGNAAQHGFQVLCQEAVRFSHAYAPSTMSQASVASMLTGLLPLEHGVRHNGPEFLSARFTTLSEAALAKNYRTAFFSGGPPIWRKSGLAQGFEVFDDTMDLSIGTPFRPAKDIFNLTQAWLKDEVGGAPFFSFLFLADLQFPLHSTKTEEGEVRERSRQAQLQEIDESIGQMITWLKKRKRWNRTHIVVAGLNGFPVVSAGPGETPVSLHSQNVQISLFIKPARKEKDNIIQWAIDPNVSLLDVSHTIFAWLGVQAPVSSIASLQPVSLESVLQSPEPNWKENRILLSESAWPDWLEGGGTRFAFRQGHFLYVHDKKPLIYNTLTDRLENMPLKVSDPLWNSLSTEVNELLRQPQMPAFKGLQPHWLEHLDIAQELSLGNEVPRRVQGTEPWARWYLRRAWFKKDWREVKRLSQEAGEPVGAYIAAKHLGEPLPLPRNPCVRMILATKNPQSYQSDCDDEKILALLAWKQSKDDEERRTSAERFHHLYGQHLFDQEVGRLNYLNGLRWDVDRELPQAPLIVDYLLTLKDFEPLSKKN